MLLLHPKLHVSALTLSHLQACIKEYVIYSCVFAKITMSRVTDKHMACVFHPFYIYSPQRPLGRVDVYLYSVFRPRHWKGVRGQRHTPAAFYPRETPATHCTGGWVGPRVGLDRCGKSRPPPGFFFRSPDRPARSQSLYRLSYPAH
jgi:hypothetical protein